MVFNAPDQVSGHLAVKKAHGQAHQFRQEVGNQRNIDAAADVQQDETPDHLDQRTAENQHQLGDQYQLDKIEVTMSDSLSTIVWVRNGKTSCNTLPPNIPNNSWTAIFR